MSLSVIVITRNEERNIGDCLASVAWADEIVVVDAESVDRTVEIARQRTPHVHVVRWKGFAAAKEEALARSAHEWILWLDADERVGGELAREIAAIAKGEGEFAAYEVARRAYFIGKWIRHSGWYPGYVTRLFRRSSARFSESKVHERLIVDGPVGRLRNDLLHYTDETLHHYLKKFNSYTTLAAEEAAAQGGRFGVADVVVRPPYMFFKMYLLKRGFLDGMHGLILALLSSAYVFSKYAKLALRPGQPAVPAGGPDPPDG